MNIDFNSPEVDQLLEEYKHIKFDTIFKFSEVIKNYGEHSKFCQQNKIDTGFPSLDKMLHGVQAGEVMYINSKTNVGKTSFLLNMIKNNLNDNSILPYFSLENNEYQLLERIIQMEKGVPFYESQNKFIKKDAEFIKEVKEIADKWKSCINIVKRVSLNEIVPYIKVCEKLTNKRAKFCAIDYFQLVKSLRSSDYERSSEIADSIKEFSLQLKLPFIVVSQVSRADSKGELTLYSGKGSGSIENSAQMVFTLDVVSEPPIQFASDKFILESLQNNAFKLLVLSPKKLKRKEIKDIYLVMDTETLRLYEYPLTEPIIKVAKVEEFPF